MLGTRKSQERLIVPTGTGAAGSRPGKNRSGFCERNGKPSPGTHAWQPSAAVSAGSPVLGRWAMDRLNATIDTIDALPWGRPMLDILSGRRATRAFASSISSRASERLR